MKRVNDEVIKDQVDYIIKRATSGSRSSWSCGKYKIEPTQDGGQWVWNIVLKFERIIKRGSVEPARLTSEAATIIDVIKAQGTGANPWILRKHEVSWDTKGIASTTVGSAAPSTTDVVNFTKAIPLSEIDIPEVLIKGSDAEIEAFPAFEGIFGRAAHIRVMLSSIKTMKDTNGLRRNHVLLHGLPGCAKSTLFLAIQKLLPIGSYLTLNANSTTRAGVESIFLDRLRQTGVPPFLFIEEIEKTLEAILTVWLSILDERAEVRKITFHDASKTEARVLCFGTANDKYLFDNLMGGRAGHPGALSSRFTKPLYVPRPDDSVMKKILLRDIKRYGGKEEWADKCIEISKEIKTNDPRIVLSFLDGAERLMDDSYKNDIMTIYQMEKDDKAIV